MCGFGSKVYVGGIFDYRAIEEWMVSIIDRTVNQQSVMKHEETS